MLPLEGVWHIYYLIIYATISEKTEPLSQIIISKYKPANPHTWHREFLAITDVSATHRNLRFSPEATSFISTKRLSFSPLVREMEISVMASL